MSETINLWFNILEEELESVRKRANQESIDSDPNDETLKDELLFQNAEIRANEFYVEEKSDEIFLDGELWCFGKRLGWINLKIPLNQDMAKDIIERYIKKFQKLKTVLEATKD